MLRMVWHTYDHDRTMRILEDLFRMSDRQLSTDDVLKNLRFEAIKRLRDAYEDVYRLSKLPLQLLNRKKTETTKYRSNDEYARDLLGRANAIGNFAGWLGIIEPEDQLDAMYEFCDNHPEFAPEGYIPGELRAALRERRRQNSGQSS